MRTDQQEQASGAGQAPDAHTRTAGSGRLTFTRLAAIGGIVCLLSLSFGLAVALVGLSQVRAELADLQAAVRASRQASARPPGPPPQVLPDEPVSILTAQLKGNLNAKVAVIEFSDFQCPFCASFAQATFPALESQYVATGKVLWAFKHLPLDQIHPSARRAAEAAECGGQEGKFWEMHDQLFLNPRRLEPADLSRYASTVGLNAEQFDRCIAGEASAAVMADVVEATRLRLSGTPAFFLGTVESGRVTVTEMLSGAKSLQAFQSVIDGLLASGS
ncbi:MAG: thioredoxin domain-containing protein [Acidobacteria bacterium]|nr:thioredoxin domain-containing protein [Acidobacteriota bacterium]